MNQFIRKLEQNRDRLIAYTFNQPCCLMRKSYGKIDIYTYRQTVGDDQNFSAYAGSNCTDAPFNLKTDPSLSVMGNNHWRWFNFIIFRNNDIFLYKAEMLYSIGENICYYILGYRNVLDDKIQELTEK